MKSVPVTIALSERRPINDDERTKLYERYRWKVLAPTRFDGTFAPEAVNGIGLG
jgi:hypothetical protein